MRSANWSAASHHAPANALLIEPTPWRLWCATLNHRLTISFTFEQFPQNNCIGPVDFRRQQTLQRRAVLLAAAELPFGFLVASFIICMDLLQRPSVLVGKSKRIKLRPKLGIYCAASILGRLRHAMGSEVLLVLNQTCHRGKSHRRKLGDWFLMRLLNMLAGYLAGKAFSRHQIAGGLTAKALKIQEESISISKNTRKSR
ncbi:MAG: hypothetical protein WA858_28995 [Xanthobacteraceae bacterium]|jgi:hypothetical protein